MFFFPTVVYPNSHDILDKLKIIYYPDIDLFYTYIPLCIPKNDPYW